MIFKKKESEKLNFQNGKKEKKKSSKINFKKIKIPKTAQETLPFKEIYSNGVIKVSDELYCTICSFTNINYKSKKEEEQESIFKKWCDVLNSLDPQIKFQLFLHNENIDEEELFKELIPEKNNYEEFQKEYEKLISSFITESYNKTADRKNYFAVGIKVKDTKNVENFLGKAIREAAAQFKILDSQVERLSIEETLEFFYNFYNIYKQKESPFILPTDLFAKGINIKDYIAPSSFRFKRNYAEIGTGFSRTMFVKDFPTLLNDGVITDLLDNPFTLSVGIHIEPTDSSDAIRAIEKKLSSLEANKYEYNKKNARQGTQYIPYNLKNAIKEAEELLDSLTKENKKMFMVGIYINIFADSQEELEDRTKTIYRVCRKHLISIDVLSYQQEDGLASVLPLCNNKVGIKRTFLTDSTAVFMPFSSQDIFQKTGFYYGRNTLSNSLLVIDRRLLQVANGFILGISGSGKSFFSKREMLNVLITTNDDVIIVDPEREYSSLCQAFNGEHIKISAASNTYINPMDLSEDYADDDDPVQLKSDFILSFCETLVGELKPQEKTILDRCTKLCYAKLVNSEYNPKYMPTLKEFYKTLKCQQEEEAKRLALALELYIEGSLNVFSHKSNITLKNRLTVFDTKDLGKQLKKLGILITLDNIWNRVCINRHNHKRTWVYTDEFYLLFDSEISSEFYFQFYKRARKWGGIPTGITQNISDLLKSETAKTMLANSQFVVLLNQASTDREKLSKILQIGENQLNYVKDAQEGSGLIVAGGNIIPFTDKFPKDNVFYKVITTKLDEVEK